MAHPFASRSHQLSGDGQLRELMQERRRHLGDGSNEALAIREPRAAEWLQLRFGGQLQPISLSSAWLMGEALELPAPAPLANVG